ncbi:MAG: hypothetical protein WC058_12760 [Phycisphaeraceae bacterium]
MKLRTLAIVIVALLFAAIASPAQAMYHPGMGRFMQRDPGPGGIYGAVSHHKRSAGSGASSHFIPQDQYGDGMNLYQYVRSNPIALVDPMGLEALMQVDVVEGDTGQIGVVVKVRLDKYECCRLVRFVQVVKEHRVGMFGQSGTGDNGVVDSPNWGGIIPAWTPWYTTDVAGPDKSGDWEWWELRDQPGLSLTANSWNTRAFSQDFETCAICISGKGGYTHGRLLGCVKWGQFWAAATDQYPEDHRWYGNKHLGKGNLPSANMLQVFNKFEDLWNGFHIAVEVPEGGGA